ncbi:MAG: nickel-type superoxide dismutase maturation protease [Actinomycetota bacterium]
MIFLDRRHVRGMGETLAWLVGRRRRVRVIGDSMFPTLTEGEFVLVDEDRTPAVGELALARHPDDADLLVVKRVAAFTADGRVDVRSDNPEAGTDSRTWGPLEAAAVVGAVTLLLDRPSSDLSRPN